MAYQRKNEKNGLALFLLLLAGIVLGGFIGHLASGISFLKWLDFGYEFGMAKALAIDLKVIFVSFRLTLSITISSIIGVAIAIFVYRKL